MATAEGLDQLYAMLAQAKPPRTIPAGEVIFDQGDEGDSMYLLHGGSVDLKNGDQVVETVGAPGLFGEMALIENNPRALTAVVASEAQLVDIPARHFWVLVTETPYFAQLVMTVMARRLRAASQQSS
jgi:CRP/FNR family cyclic AMP-dependent transcriptional regulator